MKHLLDELQGLADQTSTLEGRLAIVSRPRHVAPAGADPAAPVPETSPVVRDLVGCRGRVESLRSQVADLLHHLDF